MLFMATYRDTIKMVTKPGQFYDITDKVKKIVKESNMKYGICNIFVTGSTATILLNQNDPMLLMDIQNLLEKEIPSKCKTYRHPYNGHSHLRSMMMSCNQTIPVENNEIITGENQDILFIEQDIEPRDRKIIVTIVGEELD